MKFFIAAIFLIFLFCPVSGNSGEPAEGFHKNPEYIIPAPASAKPAAVTEKPAEAIEIGNGENDQGQKCHQGNQPVRETENSFQKNSSWDRYLQTGKSSFEQELEKLKLSSTPASLPRKTGFRSVKHSQRSSRKKNILPKIIIRSSSCCSKKAKNTVKNSSSCCRSCR